MSMSNHRLLRTATALVASLAAVEAFRNMGGDRVIADVLFVYNELKALNEANEKDEAEAALNPNDEHKTAEELFAEEKYDCPSLPLIAEELFAEEKYDCP